MASIGLIRFVTTFWLTVTSAIGLLAPLVFIKLSGVSKSVSKSKGVFNIEKDFVLSLANCFSGSMLLSTSIIHFLPHSYTTASELTSTQISYWVLGGVLIPSLMEKCMSGSHGHSHGTHESATASTMFLLFVLMCFHGMMEGILLGTEVRSESLVKITIPFCIHRFFDGVIIGTSLAKQEKTQVHVPCDEDGPPKSKSASLSRRGIVSAILWLAITPLVVLIVTFSSTVGAVRNRLSSQGTEGGDFHSDFLDRSPIVSAMHAVASGSFIFVGLSILIEEECQGLYAVLSIVAGAVVTAVLFLFSS